MKELSLENMEKIEGGGSWSWGGCAAGMAGMAFSGGAYLAGALFGPAGYLGAIAAGCVVGGYHWT